MQRILPLLASSMILLQTIIEVFVGSVTHLIAHYFTHCSWIRSVPIRCDLFRSMINHSKSLPEKLLSGLHISLLAQARSHQIAIGIDGTIKVTPLPMYLDVRLINVPRFPSLATAFCPQLLCHQWSKPLFPCSNCLRRKPPSSFEKHLGKISQTQLVSKPPQDNQEDDIGGILQEVERSSRPLIEGLLAIPTRCATSCLLVKL